MQIHRNLWPVVWLPREAVVCKQRVFKDTDSLAWGSLEMHGPKMLLPLHVCRWS